MKSLEQKDAKYKLNLNPKATFDTSMNTYCTKTEDFPEVVISISRKKVKSPNSISTLTKIDGNLITLINQVFTDT